MIDVESDLFIYTKKSFTMNLLKVSPYFHTFILQQKKKEEVLMQQRKTKRHRKLILFDKEENIIT